MVPVARRRVRFTPLAAPIAVGLLLGPLLVGYEPVGGDPDRFYRPIKQELALALESGDLPFWSDRFGLGVPLLAESHAAAFYPPNVLLYRTLSVPVAYRLSMWLHYVAIALSTYAYARRLGMTPLGGALAALAFCLCGVQSIHSSHEWMYHTTAYLPLALLLADLFATTGRTAWLASLALVLGMQWTIGHFQVQTWTGGLVLLLGTWRVVSGRHPWTRLAGLLLASLWGPAIASAQLVPSWELARFVGRTRSGFEELAFFAFPPSHWAEPIIPRLFRGLRGGPEDPYWYGQLTTGYEAALWIGTVPLIFAIIGALGRERELLPWKALVVLSIVLATMPAWFPAGYATFLRVPGLGLFRAPARYLLIASLGLSLLAGRGFDRAISDRRFRVGLALSLALALTAFAWGAAWTTRAEFRASFGAEPLSSRLGPAAITWALALLAVVAWRRGRVGAWAPFVLTAIELASLYYNMTTDWGWSIALPESSPVLTGLRDEPGIGRVGGSLGNLPVRVGLATASPYLGFPLPEPNALLSAVVEPRFAPDPEAARWRRRFGVTHLVLDTPGAVLGGTTAFIAEDPALDVMVRRPPGASGPRLWRVIRLPASLPSARLATRSVVLPDRLALLGLLSRSEGDDTAHFIATDRPPEPSHPRARHARIVGREGRSVVVAHDGACDLILTRTFYPGWSARIAGVGDRPIRPVDGGLQAVRLDGAGVHRVELRYRPTGFNAALAVSVTAAALAVLVLIASVIRSRGAAVVVQNRPRARRGRRS